MSRYKPTRLRVIPMSQRNTSIRRATRCSCNSRNDLKLNSISLVFALMLSGGVAHARYLMPTMDKVLDASTSIADVTVASFDKHGSARLTIHEELKGKQATLVTGFVME